MSSRPASVPEVAEVARLSPPVLNAPIRDILVTEGQPAQFQCTVSGDGRPHSSPFFFFDYKYKYRHILLSSPIDTLIINSLIRYKTNCWDDPDCWEMCLQICRFLGSLMTERSDSQTSSGCLIMATPASWRFREFSSTTKENTLVLPQTLQAWSHVLQLWISMVSNSDVRLLMILRYHCQTSAHCMCFNNQTRPSLLACF